jgi:signal transduction histidine kinase
MVGGEGGLLFLLLALFVGLLHRWAFQELSYMRRMESFVASFSHELKTPLSGIKSLLQTLLAQRVPAERQEELLQLGVRQAERLQRSIENVLLSGSLRAGRYQVRLEPVGVARTLESVVAAHGSAGEVNSPRLTIEWDTTPAGATVRADAHALRIVLENLVDNALKYGDGSEVRLRVRSGEGRHFIDVVDHGQGFVPPDGTHLFLPFERGERGADPDPQGSGLGLHISRSLVRRMGGELRARSAGVGQGACFTVDLQESP